MRLNENPHSTPTFHLSPKTHQSLSLHMFEQGIKEQIKTKTKVRCSVWFSVSEHRSLAVSKLM